MSSLEKQTFDANHGAYSDDLPAAADGAVLHDTNDSGGSAHIIDLDNNLSTARSRQVGELVLRSDNLLNADALIEHDSAELSMEQYGYAKLAPDFYTQCADASRQTTFEYDIGRNGLKQVVTAEMTEYEGLNQLREYLVKIASDITALRRPVTRKTALGKMLTPDIKGIPPSITDSGQTITSEVINKELALYENESRLGVDFAENLTFIGKPEFIEATNGIGKLWKHYLEKNPGLTLCIDSSTGDLERYEGERKSDHYIRDEILSTFSDQELQQYSGRIISSLADIDPESEHKIILVDDWSMSGQQIRDRAALVRKKAHELGLQEPDIEVNLLCAREDQIERGVGEHVSMFKRNELPVKAYYMAARARSPKNEDYNPHRAFITGLHSFANYNFAWTLLNMTRASLAPSPNEFSKRAQRKLGTRRKMLIPAIAKVHSSSKYASDKIAITKEGLVRL